MQTQTKFIKHEACDACGSSDAKAVYSDGSSYCFACKTHLKAHSAVSDNFGGKVLPMTNKAVTGQIKPIAGHFKSIPERGITKATCEAYGVLQTDTDHYYPYTDAKGTEVAYKVRVVPHLNWNLPNLQQVLLLYRNTLRQ